LFCKLSKEKQSFVVILPSMLCMPYSTQLVQEWQARTKKPSHKPSRTRLSEIISFTRESSREQYRISQTARFHLARDKRKTRLREICVESKLNFASHLASQFAQARFNS